MHRVAAGTKKARQMMAQTSGPGRIKSPFEVWIEKSRENTQRAQWNAAVDARNAEKKAAKAARKQNGQ